MAKRTIHLEFSETTGGISYTGPSPVATVTPVPNLQPTKPSIPLKSAFPRQTLGDSGTRMLHGIITEEYNPELQGVEGVKIFDEMRKNDGTVRAALLACTLPIRRAEWFVKPASDSTQDEEIASFIRHALFDWHDMSWDDVLRQALLMTAFGVMAFEKVYGTHDDEVTKKTYVTLNRLAPRLPKSVLMWELTDQTFGIQQIRQDGVLAQIPGSKLLIFVNEREGDNWWGNSMLRAAYKHWYYKTNFYKIDAVSFERQGMGVPYIKMPIGYTSDDEQNAKRVMANLRANEAAYVVLPPDYEAGFLDMGARSTRDPKDSIEHHDMKILQSVLAQFLQLGAARSSSGSRALSQDHSDLFLKAMEAIANTIRDTFTKDCIKELVDLNFDDVKDYPVLDYSGITKVDIAALGTSLAQLATAGFLSATDDDQQWVRAALGMPARTQEQIDEANEDDPSSQELEMPSDDVEDIEEVPGEDEDDDDTEDASGTTGKPAPKPNSGTPKPATGAGKGKEQKVEKNAKGIKPKPNDGTKAQTDAKPAKQAKASDYMPSAHFHAHGLERTLKRKFDDGHGFMSWRPLTMSEGDVDWQQIEDKMDSLEDDLSDKARNALSRAKDKFMTDLHQAIADNDAKAVGSLELGFVTEYQRILKKAMLDAYDFGKNKASNEIGVTPPSSKADSLAAIDAAALAISKKAAADLEAQAKLSALQSMKTGNPALQEAGLIDKDLDDAIDKHVDNVAPTIVGQAVNNGRNDVFERNGAMIHSLQRSEILDNKTCNFCMSMDGRTIEPTDEWGSQSIFHTNCRGIWVAILKDEANPPATEGIPGEIGDHYGGEVNSVVQPKTPIVKPGGLADMYLKRQAEAERAQVTP